MLLAYIHLQCRWHTPRILMLKIQSRWLKNNVKISTQNNISIKNLLLNVIYLLLKIYSLFLSVLKHNMVLNLVQEILGILSSMMLIYLNVSVLVTNLNMFIKEFGQSLYNMNLLKSSLKLTLQKEQKSKILIAFLEIYINWS